MYCGLLKFKYSIIYTSNISTHSSHSFVMGQILQICPCPCLKAKKKQFSYDVHEQTFQMDDQIQGQALPKSSQNRYDKQFIDPKTDAQSDLGSENKMLPQNWQQNQKIDSENEKVEAQKKYIQEKNRQSQQTMKMEFQSDKQQSKINQSVRENILQAEQKHVKPQKSTNPNILSIKKIKKKYNPDDYRFLNEENQFKVKKIDSIKQQQFNIDGCRNCIFFIFDITANVYIDNTQNCFIFIAPCESTIFVRSCKKLYIVAACKQFRTVDCSDCQFSLYCKSQPVIESSSNMVFAPFDCPMYPSLAKQFSKAKLQIWNNHWSQIHNFTKKEGQKDYFLRRKLAWNLTLDVNQIPWNRALKQAQLQQVQNSIVVPFIKGELSQKQQLEQQQGQQQQIKLTKKALIIFNASISKDNDQIEKVISYKTLNQKQFVLLKANCNKFSQMGTDPLVALLIKYNNEQLLQGLQHKTKLLITDEDDIQQKSSTYFMNFGDER